MGFMDKLGEMAGNAVNDYSSAYNKAEGMDNRKLFETYKSETNYARKLAYGAELQKRKEEIE